MRSQTWPVSVLFLSWRQRLVQRTFHGRKMKLFLLAISRLSRLLVPPFVTLLTLDQYYRFFYSPTYLSPKEVGSMYQLSGKDDEITTDDVYLNPIVAVPNRSRVFDDRMWPVPGKPLHVYFIHVGKTGGITLERRVPIPMKQKLKNLDCVMGAVANRSLSVESALDHCNPERHNETPLAKRIVSHFHVRAPLFSRPQKRWLLEHTNTMLYTIRNPIDRIVSAFYYHYNQNYRKKPKPRNQYSRMDAGAIFFLDCFPNASLTTAIASLQANSTNIETLCRFTAHRAFQGHVTSHKLMASGKKFAHFLYNYQWYLERYYCYTKAIPDVVVVRTEHLWEDAMVLDRAMGGNAEFALPGTAFTHGSEDLSAHRSTNTLTAHHSLTLCCILYRDLQAYQTIVGLALNLGRAEKEETLRELFATCGVDYGSAPVFDFSWKSWYSRTCTDVLWKTAM